jgi:hypothetical protein
MSQPDRLAELLFRRPGESRDPFGRIVLSDDGSRLFAGMTIKES